MARYQVEDRDVVSEFFRMFENVIRLLDTAVDARDLKEYLGGFRDGNGKPYIAPSLYSDCRTTGEILKSLRPQYIHYMHLHLLQNIVEHYGIDESKALVQQYDENFPRSVPLKLLPHPLSEEEIQACHCVGKLTLCIDRDYDKFNKVELESIEGFLRSASNIGISQLALVYANSASGSLLLTFLIPEAWARASAFMDTTDPRFLHLFDEAMKEGHIDAQIVKCLFIGAAGSGKTNTIYLLFGWPPPPERHSTGCIESIRAVSCIKISSDGEVWERVDSTKLRSLLAGDVYFTFSDSIASFSEDMPEESLGEPVTVSPPTSPVYTPSQTGAAIAREMSKGMPDGGKLRDVKWTYLIDSGGQSQFHRVLSAFLKDTSAGVFVLNLLEELSDHPLMELYDHGSRRGESHRSPLTNEEIFRSCVQTVQSLPYTTKEGKSPKTFVIGTYRDQEMPGTRARKNEQLLKVLVPTEGCKESSFHSNIVYSDFSKKEVIHAINATSREKPDTDIAQELRKKIENIESPVRRIPHRWYGLELEMESFAATNKRMIVTLEECLHMGKTLHFPSDEAVKAALVHLHNLNIFLYYPDVLPDLVFTDPCVLLDKVRELVQKSYQLKGLCPSNKPHEATEGMWSRFCDRGIITSDILEEFPSHVRDREYLYSQQLLELFEHLLIIASISATEFFMPALLDLCKPDEIVRPSSQYASAYIISFPNGYAPCGLCSALVACLCSSEHNPRPWAFATSSRSGKLYGNCITFNIPDVIASVTLIDSGSYFEVYVNIKTRPSLRSSRYRSACPQVRQTIDDCLKKAITVRNFQHVKCHTTILCQCKDIICQCDTNSCQCEAGTIEPHPARLVIDTYPYFWQCPYDTSISDTLEDKELMWFPEPTPAEQPSRDISLQADAVPVLSQVSCSNATASPDIILTHVNKSRIVQYLRRIARIQDLLRLGEGLGLDGRELRRNVNSDISLDDMVGEWLERKHRVDEVGRPSWRVLIKVLRDVGQNGLANDIEEGELKLELDNMATRSSVEDLPKDVHRSPVEQECIVTLDKEDTSDEEFHDVKETFEPTITVKGTSYDATIAEGNIQKNCGENEKTWLQNWRESICLLF